MPIQHKNLAAGRWFDLSLMEQLANTGSEVERTIKWKEKGNPSYSDQAFVRALELLDLILNDPKNRKRLKEITRVRELLVDYFCFDNRYQSSDEKWRSYFLSFNYAVRKEKLN